MFRKDSECPAVNCNVLCGHHKIQDEVFNAVSNKYGTKKTVDITALIGHYLLVGQILSAFEVDLAEGMTAEITD